MYFNSQFFPQFGQGGVAGMMGGAGSLSGSHPSPGNSAVQHSMNMLYMDSIQRQEHASQGEFTFYKAFLANSNFVHFSKLQNPGILRTIIGLVWTYQWKILDNSFLFLIFFPFVKLQLGLSPGQVQVKTQRAGLGTVPLNSLCHQSPPTPKLLNASDSPRITQE